MWSIDYIKELLIRSNYVIFDDILHYSEWDITEIRHVYEDHVVLYDDHATETEHEFSEFILAKFLKRVEVR